MRSYWGPGVLLGIGLGGFVDGIVLHQILQWHHLLSERPYTPTIQVMADGLFHSATWLAVLTGLLWLFYRMRGDDDTPKAWRALLGPMLAGWGLFNLVEGTVNHHLLGLHHVRDGEYQTAWDVGFLVFGAMLLAAGTLLERRASRPKPAGSDPRPSTPFTQ